MTAQEVHDIFNSELERNDTRKALINTHYLITADILEELVRSRVSEGDWELLLSAAFSRSHLALVIDLEPCSVSILPEEFMREVIYLYDRWLVITTHLHDNFDELASPEFKELWLKEHLMELRGTIAKRHQELSNELKEKQSLSMNLAELKVMNVMFLWFQQVMLGKDLFLEYAAKINALLPILRKFQAELLLPENLESEVRLPENTK